MAVCTGRSCGVVTCSGAKAWGLPRDGNERLDSPVRARLVFSVYTGQVTIAGRLGHNQPLGTWNGIVTQAGHRGGQGLGKYTTVIEEGP